MAPVLLIPTLSPQNKLNSGKELCINSLYFANKQDHTFSSSPMEMGQILKKISQKTEKRNLAFTCCSSPYIVIEPLQQGGPRQEPILGHVVPMLNICTLLGEQMLY